MAKMSDLSGREAGEGSSWARRGTRQRVSSMAAFVFGKCVASMSASVSGVTVKLGVQVFDLGVQM